MKSIFRSKTFWVALAWTLLSIANYFGYGFEYSDAEEIVGQNWQDLVNAIFGAVMIVLRGVTEKGVYIFKRNGV